MVKTNESFLLLKYKCVRACMCEWLTDVPQIDDVIIGYHLHSMSVLHKHSQTVPFWVVSFLSHFKHQPLPSKGYQMHIISSLCFVYYKFPVLSLHSSPWWELVMLKLLGFSFIINLKTYSISVYHIIYHYLLVSYIASIINQLNCQKTPLFTLIFSNLLRDTLKFSPKCFLLNWSLSYNSH